MKQIKIPTDQSLLDLLDQTSKNIQEYANALSQYGKPYDQIIVLRMIKKNVNSILKETGN